MKAFFIIWTILIIIALLSIPVVAYYGFFIMYKKVRKKQRDNWIKEVGLLDLNMDYKTGYIDAIKKTEIFDK